jgi:hypothetical protein
MPQLPDPTRADDIDVVPGTPPVPITVWRTPTCPGDRLVGDRLAARLLAAYTRRGDLVYDTTGQPAVREAAGAAGRRYATGRGTTGPVGLVVTWWPPADPGIDPMITLGGLRRRLHPQGVLAAVITTKPEAPPVDLARLVHAAGQAGLSYLQHIVAVHAHPTGDRLTPPPTDGQAPPAPAVAGAAHLRVHTDVLIFQPLAGAHARR